MMRLSIFTLVLLLAGCARTPNPPVQAPAPGNPVLPAPAPAVAPIAAGKAPELEEEKVVAAYILDHANDPRSVEFAKWGPHDLEGELSKVWGAKGMLKAVRCAYRSKNAAGALVLEDGLFLLGNTGQVAIALPNRMGDNWHALARVDLERGKREEAFIKGFKVDLEAMNKAQKEILEKYRQRMLEASKKAEAKN